MSLTVLLLQTGISKLYSLIGQLWPLIFMLVLIMMVFGLFSGRKRGGLLAITLVLGLSFFGFSAVVSVSAAPNHGYGYSMATASVLPGSITTYEGAPVTETIRGLDPTSTTYDILEGSTIIYDDVAPDTAGILVVICTPSDYGMTVWTVKSNSTTSVATFTITNQSVIDYLVPVFMIAFIVGIFSFLLGLFGGRRGGFL